MANMASARIALVLGEPFFGALLCHLKIAPDPTCKTAWTDGTTLGYNPAYVDSLTHAELVGLLAHEVLHCAGAHPFRRDAREPKRWNIACDIAINQLIEGAGMTLPKGSPQATPDMVGKSAEYIYDRLPPSPPQPQGSKGDGAGDDMAPGEVRDAPQGEPDTDGQDDGNGPATEADWNERTRQAAQQAKMRGNLPGGLDRFSEATAQAKVDWQSELRRFVQQAAKTDYTWSRPSPRYIGSDIYLPAIHSEALPGIVIAVDTSGSMDDVSLAKAKAEVMAVMSECQPARIDVMYADARVAGHDTFERGDEIVFRPKGGGGTSFKPVFAAVAELEEQPVCVIYITDLCGDFPDSPVEVPTLWVTDSTHLSAPFGDTIRIGY